MSSPIIFEKGTRDFSTLGLGLLSDAIQATTTEELNGQFIFEMDYPADGNNADLIKENRIIVVDAGHILKRQGFIIRQIIRKIDLTMSVYAEHVSYATLDVALGPLGTVTGSAKTALENWKRMLVPAVDFTVDSDILTNNSTQIGAPEFETARQGLGGHAGSILDVWGGEYKFDNWRISLLKQRGKAANAIIAYGRNLTSFEQDTNIADTYTSVYPYYQERTNDNVDVNHFLPERIVNSEHVDKYPNPKVFLLDLSDKFKDAADYSETKLRNYALAYIKSNNFGVPKVNMKISTVDLSKATGGFAEDVDLGDTVNVYFEKLDITTSAKIIKAVWNVLSDSYDKFEIGARRASLTESVTELATTANENATKALNQAVTALQSADGKSTIYYLNSGEPWPENPKENDTAFVKDGENTIMYRYLFNNETGEFSWVKILDALSADRIEQKVSDTLESAQKYSDKLVADNAEQVNRVLSDVQDKQVALKNEQIELDRKAQGYANQALADAKSDTQATVSQAARDAQQALANAKTELTESISNEVRDRTNALTALDKKATDAINQAKNDAQSAVNALQIGGRNLLLNTKEPRTATGNNTTNQIPWQTLRYTLSGGLNSGKMLSEWGLKAPFTVSFDWSVSGTTLSGTFFPQFNSQPYGFNAPSVAVSSNNTSGHYVYTSTAINPNWANTTANLIYFRLDNFQGVLTIANLKLEKGNKATDYTEAPEDVVLDYTNKDNVIKQSLTQYQEANDGRVTKAQSEVTQALNMLGTKVSQTSFDQKTGDLETKYTNVKQTADKATTDIAAIKTKDNSQDTRMANIERDANGLRSTVSSIQTTQGQQSGAISSLQQRADGFDATVTKVNNMAVGGRNLVLNSGAPRTGVGTNTTNNAQSVFKYTLANGLTAGGMITKFGVNTPLSVSFDWSITGSVISGTFQVLWSDAPWGMGQPTITVDSTRTSGHCSFTTKVHSDWAGKTADSLWIRMDNLQGTLTLTNFKFEQGNMPTAWTPAPEDQDSATARAQLTADNATLALNAFKTDADGRISKAQADIIVNANAITQKVSQTDYNTKTGQIDSQISSIKQTATSISQSVTNVQNQVNGLSVGGTNLLLDTLDYSNQRQVWRMESVSYTNDGPKGLKATNTSSIWGGPEYLLPNLESRGLINTTDTYTFSAWVKNTSSNTVNVSTYANDITWISGRSNNIPANSDWVRIKTTFKFNKATGNNSTIRYEPNVSLTSGAIKLAGHKLEFGNMATDYSPAPEDTEQKISTINQTVDSISNVVSNPTTGLSKRVQTAEGTLSQVHGVDIPALKKATYWQAPVGYDLNTYLTQGSFFFNNTTARTNGPTSRNDWLYLVVEQGSSSRVTQIAWYDQQNDAKITYKRHYTSGSWSPWYANDNNSVATIATMNGKITTEISDRQNGDTNTLTQAKSFTTSSINSSESGMKSLITQTSDAILGKVGATNLFPNSEFEKDYGYRSKNGTVTLSLANKDLIDGKYNGTVRVVSTASGWQGYWARSIEVQGGQKYSASVLVHYTNGGTTNGNAVLDIWFVDKDSNRINQGTGGSGSRFTGQVSSPYWVKLWAEGFTAPTNAVGMEVSLLVNNVGAGQTAVFTQPMVTATEKLQPYVPNNDITTQLALLKDNWSIGIADNIGAITSGIVGNANSMSLISNKVIINAPQTQIKGTAWITSAMIGDGQIGTAQIGDAAITNAKIANLDVNKLTGNVSNFIQSNWNGKYASTTIDGSGMLVNGGNTTTKFDTTGAHYTNSSGISATYSFGRWSDANHNATSSTGLYLGATGSDNSFINILGTNGAAALVLAGSTMDYGANQNIMQGTLNAYVNVNIRQQLHFKGNKYNSPAYIEINENTRTFNFFTGGGSQGGGNYFWFNQNVLSAGSFSSTSVLSKKNVKSVYDEDALSEIAKTQLVNFAYKNRPDQNHVSPIIDDVNEDKQFYIPKTILGQDDEYVDMYSMISMAWRAIQQLNDKIGDR